MAVQKRGGSIDPLVGLLLQFHEGDLSPLDKEHGPGSIPLSHIGVGEDRPYITKGIEKRSDGMYDVVTCSMYYQDNPAIGVGWKLRPKDPNLGYHPDDVEYVSIYYKDGVPKKVYFSEHSGNEGQWRAFKDCRVQNGFLVVYVARNSHANYFDNGNNGEHKRIRGFANDYTSTRGPARRYPFDYMTPSFDWERGGRRLYSGLRPAPPDNTLSAHMRDTFRWSRTFKIFGKKLKVTL